jgi:hypothetical protein
MKMYKLLKSIFWIDHTAMVLMETFRKDIFYVKPILIFLMDLPVDPLNKSPQLFISARTFNTVYVIAMKVLQQF